MGSQYGNNMVNIAPTGDTTLPLFYWGLLSTEVDKGWETSSFDYPLTLYRRFQTCSGFYGSTIFYKRQLYKNYTGLFMAP